MSEFWREMNDFWWAMFTVWMGALAIWAAIGLGVTLYGAPQPLASNGGTPTALEPAGQTPAPTPTLSPSPTANPHQMDSATPTATPTPTPTPSPTPTPAPQHSDSDLLSDERERELGTDPEYWDTDRDGIPDHVEVRGNTSDGTELPGSDPLHKDLYIQTYWSYEANPPPGVYGDIQSYMANLSVSNPDGTTGVTVHVDRDGLIEHRLEWEEGETNWPEIIDAVEHKQYHRTVVVMHFEDDSYLGVGQSPGYLIAFNEATDDDIALEVLAHEVMHTILGEIDGPETCEDDTGHYCADGLMEPYYLDQHNPRPAKGVTDQLNETGFKPRHLD